MSLKSNAKWVQSVCAAWLVCALAGCGVDDVQLNGKIFDVVGLNTGTVKAKEPKLIERQPLLVPPAMDKLPAPGSGKASQPVIADVQDYDAKRQISKSELERQHAEFCKKNYTDPKNGGDQSADSVEGPLGPCRSSILSSIKKWTSGDQEEEQQ